MLFVLAISLVACTGVDGVPEVPAQELVIERGVLEPRVVLTGDLQAVGAIEITVPRTPNWEMAGPF